MIIHSKKSRPATLEDVARKAGVSRSTASRSLRDHPRIGKETVEIVKAAAATLNYRPNAAARNLTLRSSDAVAMILPCERESGRMASDPFFMDLIGSIADALREENRDLLISVFAPDAAGQANEIVASNRALGLIVVGKTYHEKQIKELSRSSCPFIVLGGDMDADYCAVTTDNASGGEMATRHLWNIGRRRIMFLGNPDYPEVDKRYEGYCKALSSFGEKPCGSLLVKTEATGPKAAAAIAKAIDDGISFDAIFAASDVIAMNAIKILHDAGMRTPQDVAVVGYDDIHLSEHFFPPLTTVRQDIARVGRAAVKKLLALQAGEAVHSEILQPQLVVRQSCGAPDALA